MLGGGGVGSVWNLGSARGPFTAKIRPLFDESAFPAISGVARVRRSQRHSCECECYVLAGHLPQSRGLPGRKPRKSLQKVFPALPAQSLKKVPKRSKKKPPQGYFSETFWGLSDLFGVFLRLRARRPMKTLWRLFRGFSGRGTSRLL